MKKSLLVLSTIGVLLFGLTQTVTAALVGQGDGTIYDPDLDISWLADVNLVLTKPFGVTPETPWGAMWWSTAQAWISGMNAANYLGYNNWRLPSSDGACTGYLNCDSNANEMAHLFYTELGGAAFTSIKTTHNAYYSLFTNVANFDLSYWYSNAPDVWGDAFYFKFGNGGQGKWSSTSAFFALPVHPGASSVVPVPGALWLMGAGLLGLIGIARRRKRV